MWLNPAIRRHPEEAAIVGRLLLSYGELELMVAECLGNALFDRAIALQAIFSIMGESARINLADALMRSRYVMWKLEGEYGLAIGAMKQCIQIRNQYAHCTWGDAEGAGLFFTNLQDGSYSVRRFEFDWRHIDVACLTEQEAYFDYTAEALQFIQYESQLRAKAIKAHAFQAPKSRKPPMRHNLRSGHVPPWLTEGEKQRHLDRAQILENPDRPREAR